jgi:hypothetical protein
VRAVRAARAHTHTHTHTHTCTHLEGARHKGAVAGAVQPAGDGGDTRRKGGGGGAGVAAPNLAQGGRQRDDGAAHRLRLGYRVSAGARARMPGRTALTAPSRRGQSTTASCTSARARRAKASNTQIARAAMDLRNLMYGCTWARLSSGKPTQLCWPT